MSSIKILKFQAVPPGKLLGYLDIEIAPLSIQIFDIAVVNHHNNIIFFFPSKEISGSDNRKTYKDVIRFSDKQIYLSFIKALKEVFFKTYGKEIDPKHQYRTLSNPS